MTTLSRPPLTELDLALSQLAAVQLFTSQLGIALADVSAATRESRLDASRRLDVLHRKQQALVARAHLHLEQAGGPLFVAPPVRAVLAHRSPWFVDKVSAGLTGAGVEVVAHTVNGAEAVGITVAEQPDLLLVEDALEMLGGEHVIRDVRVFSPTTAVAAQVPYGDRVGAMLEAGAATVFTRQVPPADVAAQLRALLVVSQLEPGASSPLASAS